ncbi:hypothetical protein [Helicobacter sp.]|nr:hypothetical protein [Helicobacter sp.]MDY5556313.1 hypothetical protein [Helicobacter sp.]
MLYFKRFIVSIYSLQYYRLPRFLTESRNDRGIRHEDKKPKCLFLRHCEE